MGQRDQFGVWTVHIPIKNGKSIKHNTRLKCAVKTCTGWEDRIPAWITYAKQSSSLVYDGVFWDPLFRYEFIYPRPELKENLKIYECHIGMSSELEIVNTYQNFRVSVLPKIKETGYNAIQLMGIMEHVYYGSFGYHVTNFFAVSSRYGNPEELKELIDTAHGMGLVVILDIVHSHASMNVLDGLNRFDGTDHHYFHEGKKGYHELWDSRLFNYSSWEVLRFLLSNLKWYLDEYCFDGFRFDGITSMIYQHHLINYPFSGKFPEYFTEELLDMDAQVYLMLANDLIHEILPSCISIAEDVSGMPTLCRPLDDGGFGFDYRLNMAVPDKWIQLLKEVRDEDWSMGDIAYALTNRRSNEKSISYAESHDQCIVGDKTISQWLFGDEIYSNMKKNMRPTPVIDRGIALHKMIRLLTQTLGGEAYLTFMGNEFAHPEWVDFPRKGNNWSHYHCRRLWHLRDDSSFYYNDLWKFDKAMNELENQFRYLSSETLKETQTDERNKIIAFERGELLFVFNFHPTRSFEHYRVGTVWPVEHIIVFDTDEERFSGFSRLNEGHLNPFPFIRETWNNRPYFIQLYLPSRTGIVLRPMTELLPKTNVLAKNYLKSKKFSEMKTDIG